MLKYEVEPKSNRTLNLVCELDAPLGVAGQHDTLALCSVVSI